MFDISGTINHMIVIYGAHMQNDNAFTSFFIFSKFRFLGLLGVKVQNTVQNDNKFSPSRSISQEPYIMIYMI